MAESIEMPFVLTAIALATLITVQEQHPFLRDEECGTAEILMDAANGVSIYARCEAVQDTRVMHLKIHNDAAPTHGALRTLSIEFCGQPVIDAKTSPEWRAEISSRTRTVVEWISRSTDKQAMSDVERLSGFIIVLKPGWARAGAMSASWADETVFDSVTLHACG